MDNRPGARRAAGSVLLSDQVMVMPRHGASDDKHLLLVPWSLISFQLDAKGPIHLRHLYNMPLSVCRFFLSEPTKGNEYIMIFFLVSLHSFFPLLCSLQFSGVNLTFASPLVIRIHFSVLKELVPVDWLGVRELNISSYCIQCYLLQILVQV